MKPLRLMTLVVVATIVALCYVHQRVQLVILSYTVRDTEAQHVTLVDRHAALDYNVLALRSPSQLEHRLAKRRAEFEIPSRREVVQIDRVPRASPRQTAEGIIGRARGMITRLYNQGRVAEAKPVK